MSAPKTISLLWLAIAWLVGLCHLTAWAAPPSASDMQPRKEVSDSPPEEKRGAEAVRSSSNGLQWNNPEQKERCEALLTPLNLNLSKARDYSIYGDPCSSAEHARLFREDVERVRKECPEGFLKHHAISERTVKNVNTLYIIGKKRCRQPEGAPPQ